jgi:RNA polymerase sigma factor (sigma-70 family)
MSRCRRVGVTAPVLQKRVTDAGTAELPEAELRQLEVVLYRFALRATRNPDVARDLTQDALVAALAQQSSFAGRSSLRTWVIGILSHKVLDHFRRSASRLVDNDSDAEEDLLSAPSDEDIERVVSARQQLAAVERALRTLPELERLAVMLVDVEQVDHEDSCHALGVTATHLRVLLHRGRNRLRRKLEHDR